MSNEFRVKYHWSVYKEYNSPKFMIGAGNGFEPTRPQATIWTQDKFHDLSMPQVAPFTNMV